MKYVIFASLTLLATQQVAAQDTGISLLCNGGGVAKATKTVTANSWDKDDKRQTTTMSVPSETSYSGQSTVEIGTGVGRIRLPDALLPPLHGGEGGWYELRKLDMGDSEIRGEVALNFMNHPKLRIDRMAGTIEISGSSGSFQGNCVAQEVGSGRKF